MKLRLAIKSALLTSVMAASVSAFFTTSAFACDSECMQDQGYYWDNDINDWVYDPDVSGVCGSACDDDWPNDPWPPEDDTYVDTGSQGSGGGSGSTTGSGGTTQSVDAYMECTPTNMQIIPYNMQGGVQIIAQYACDLYCDGTKVDSFFQDWRIAYPGTGFPGTGSSVTIPVEASSCQV